MPGGFKINTKGEIIYFTVQSFDAANGVTHGFSTRQGGLSDPPYASLNLGTHTGDELERVQQNRQRLCNALGLDPAALVTAEQVHGDHVQVVGAADAGKLFPATDAMITRERMALMTLHADCVPVLIYDPRTPAVGVAHAGWRGTVLKIAPKTIAAMGTVFGTQPADCLVGIGPSIGPCSYEVDAKVMAEFQAAFAYWQDLAEEKDAAHWYLDLWEANRQSIIGAGVPEENITLSGMCTQCNQDMLFSYRGEHGITGRLAAVIKLK